MEFEETTVAGAFVIKPRRIEDERGWFARIWCENEFAEAGLTAVSKQINMGHSRRKGTLRGLHYQVSPHQEVKVLRCTRGSMFDVVVDLRRDSPTYREWYGVELNDQNNYALYVPEGCATGYLTLEDDVAMSYQASEFYHSAAARGLRFDDPAINIEWPIEIVVMSEQDSSWPYLDAPDHQSADPSHRS